MDHDRKTDTMHSEPPPEFTPSPIRDRSGSMSLGNPPNANGDDVSPINGESQAHTGPPPPADANAQVVHEVVNSEVCLLVRGGWEDIADAHVRLACPRF